MGAKTLRASILQMAIEGKLVPQLDDEPAVAQIGEAPEDVPFAIPEKWKWCFIGNCVNQIRAGGDKPAIFSKDKTADCTIPVIANGEKNLGIVGYTNEGIITQRSLTVSGRGTIGFSAIRTPPFTPIVRLLVVFESPEKYISLEYLQFFLASLNLEGNGSAVKQLTAPMLRQTTIPVPPIAEQRRIVAHLNKLLPLVDKFGKAQEALAVAQKEFPEKLKASLLQEAIQGKLVPQLDEEPSVEQIGDAPEDVPFAIPGKWKWCRLKHLGTLVTGNTPSTSNRCYYGHDIPFIKPDDIGYDSCVRYKKEGLSNAGRAVAKIVPPKSLLMVCIGGSIGKVAIINDEVAFNQQINAIYCNSSVVIVEYLLSVMSSSYFQNTVIATATGTATPIINKSKWGNIFIPIPPLTLQRRIVARLNELLPLVTQIAATTAK